MVDQNSVALEDFVGKLERNTLFTKNQTRSSSFKKAYDRSIKAFKKRNLIEIDDGTITMTEEGQESIEAKKFWEGFNKKEE